MQRASRSGARCRDGRRAGPAVGPAHASGRADRRRSRPASAALAEPALDEVGDGSRRLGHGADVERRRLDLDQPAQVVEHVVEPDAAHPVTVLPDPIVCRRDVARPTSDRLPALRAKPADELLAAWRVGAAAADDHGGHLVSGVHGDARPRGGRRAPDDDAHSPRHHEMNPAVKRVTGTDRVDDGHRVDGDRRRTRWRPNRRASVPGGHEDDPLVAAHELACRPPTARRGPRRSP